MFEASEPGPRSIEDRVLREQPTAMSVDRGGRPTPSHRSGGDSGHPAPREGSDGSRRALLRRATPEESKVAEAPGRSNPDRKVRRRACAEAGARVHIASHVAPKGRPAREIDPHRPDDPWVPGNRYLGPPSGLRRNGVRFTARGGRPRSERPPPRKRVGGRERAGTCHPWTSVRAGEPRTAPGDRSRRGRNGRRGEARQ